MKSLDVNQMNKFIVSLYKAGSFVLLTLILLGLLSYLGSHIFYFVNQSWITPTVIATTDPEVLRLSTELAQQSTRLDELITKKTELETRLEDSRRIAQSDEVFLRKLESAFNSDLSAKKAELARLKRLLAKYRNAQNSRNSSDGKNLQVLSENEIRELLEAKLISPEEAMTRNYRIVQQTQDSLTMEARALDLENRRLTLQRKIQSFISALEPKSASSNNATLRAEDVVIAQEYRRTVLAVERGKDTVETLEKSLVLIDRSIARYKKLIKALQSSPYMQATDRRMTVATAPYENLSGLQQGAAIYSCLLGPVLCSQVGTIKQIMDGEVEINHPVLRRRERGLMLEITLMDEESAKKPILFIGYPPFLI